MPTAVERVADFLSDILKLDAIDNRGAQAGFPTLDGQVDAGITALGFASSPRDFASRRPRLRRGVRRARPWRLRPRRRSSRRRRRLRYRQHPAGRNQRVRRRRRIGTQADFGTLDRALFGAGGDLETFGADFVRSRTRPLATGLATLETKLTGDATTLATDFINLGGDLGTFVNDLDGGANAVTATSRYAGLAAALTPIEAQFKQIGLDFTGLAGAFGGGGGSGSPILSAVSSGGGGAGNAVRNGVRQLRDRFPRPRQILPSAGRPARQPPAAGGAIADDDVKRRRLTVRR